MAVGNADKRAWYAFVKTLVLYAARQRGPITCAFITITSSLIATMKLIAARLFLHRRGS